MNQESFLTTFLTLSLLQVWISFWNSSLTKCVLEFYFEKVNCQNKSNVLSVCSSICSPSDAFFFLSSQSSNPFVCLDLSLSQWRVQVELLVDAVQTTNGQIALSLPELDSERILQTQFLTGKTRNTFTLNINTVLWGKFSCAFQRRHCCFRKCCFHVANRPAELQPAENPLGCL